ncbi:unnamed protein product [Dicrocoelium dendriticum]|nr:unnamed protein product [Dicrocoelium dendriticum]
MSLHIPYWGSGCSLLQYSIPLAQVCELDIIFHFEKAYYVLDEFILGGEVQETGKDTALNYIDMQDLMQEEECKTREEQADISVIDVSEF